MKQRRLSLVKFTSIPFFLTAGLAACSVITEKGVDTIVFSHHLHSEQGAACADCHGMAEKVDEMAREMIPGKTACAECHDVEDKDGCASCHRNPKARLAKREAQERFLIFSHRTHAETGEGCEDCHRGAAHWPDMEGGQASRSRLGHGDCASCHKRELDDADCQKCHQNLDVTAQKARDIYSHEDGFFKTHGIKAAGNPGSCANCHEQFFCVDCHDRNGTMRPSLRFPERVDRSFIHRGDWLTRHALEARMGDPACLKCHGSSYCSSCHERNGVGGALGQQNPHRSSPNWMAAAGPGSHGREARRRIGDCAACHDQGPSSNCLECHSERGVHGFNPHPPGWDPPVPKGQRSTHRMCRVCHL